MVQEYAPEGNTSHLPGFLSGNQVLKITNIFQQPLIET